MNETCLILFADQKSNIVSEKTISEREKNEVISKSLPKGSYWKLYSGGRSLACFSLGSSDRFALSYSVITDSAVIPIINYIILQEYDTLARILWRRLAGIQSAYFRRINRFIALSESPAILFARNLLSLRVSGKEETPTIKFNKKRHQYEDALQWRTVENTIISLASRNMKKISDFRTLSLETDDNFKLIGIADKNE